MADVEHRDVSLGNRHSVQEWEHANEAARLAESVVPADVGKFSLQTDTGRLYALLDDSPMVWGRVEIDLGPQSIAFSTAPTVDLSTGSQFLIGAMTADILSLSLSGGTPGQSFVIRVVQDSDSVDQDILSWGSDGVVRRKSGESIVPTTGNGAETLYAGTVLADGVGGVVYYIAKAASGGWADAPQPSPPTIVSAWAESPNRNQVVVEFSEPVTITDTTGWSLAGTGLSITGVSGSGTDTLTFTLDGNLDGTETFTIDASGSNNVVSVAFGLSLAADSESVINNAYPLVLVDFDGDLLDKSGRSVTVTNNGVSLVSGVNVSGQVGDFVRGQTDYLRVTQALGAQYTKFIILDIQRALSAFAEENILSGTNGSSAQDHVLWFSSNGSVLRSYHAGSTAANASVTATINPASAWALNQVHSIAVTHDGAGNTKRMYIDGVLDVENTGVTVDPTAGSNLDIGAWNGVLTLNQHAVYAAVWDRALTAAQIAKLHQLHVGGA